MNSIHSFNIQKNERLSNLVECVSQVSDFRIERCRKHALASIIVIAICATLGGANNMVSIAQFGTDHLEWFEKFLDLKNGIPSHDTFSRVFEQINPNELQFWLWLWLEGADAAKRKEVLGEHISIDGKGLTTYSSRMPICIVRAWSHEFQAVTCSVRVAKKSNEITAIPQILEILNLKGKIVTIDAIGAQKDIVKKIRQEGAHYLITLKGNQQQFYKDVRDFVKDVAENNFDKSILYNYHKTENVGHGRHEVRECWTTENINWLEQKSEWEGLKSISLIRATVIKNNKTSIAERCFISSLPANATNILNISRDHWKIENQLHWNLDADFEEDRSTIRKWHGPLNMSLIRSIGLSLLKNSDINRSIKGKRALISCSLRALLKTIISRVL